MAQVNLGELYVKIGANTDALASLPPVIKSLEVTINKLDLTISKLNNSMSKSFNNVAMKAIESSQKISKAAETKAKAEENAAKRIARSIRENEKFTKSQDKVSKSAKESAAVFGEYFSKPIDKYNALSEGLLQVGTRARGASAHLSESTSKARNLGFAAQNVAYQMQDMIVQFELGTDASRVLGQQLPQLLSGFGVIGSIVGVAAAGIAAVIPLMLSSGDASEKASKKLEKYNSALESSKSIIDQYEESQARLDGTLSAFRVKDLRIEFEKLQQELKLFEPGLITGFSGKRDIEDRLFKISQAFTLARRDIALATENGIKTDINQTNAIIAQIDSYNRGIITLREYEIQKKIIEGIENLAIQDNKEAIALLKERIRLQTELGDKESFEQIARDVNDLNTNLFKSNRILQDTTKYGINAGESLKQYFSLTDQVKEHERALKDAGEEQARYTASQLGISTAGLTNEQVFHKVAVAIATITKETNDATNSTNNLIEVQKNVANLIDRIAGFKAGGGVFGQMFTPELFKQVSEFEKRTREVQRNLEFKIAAGDTSAVVNSINEYSKAAAEAGIIDPFAGIDPTNTRAVAVGIVKVEQSINNLEQRAVKVASSITQIISQAASLFSQLSNMYAEQAAYHKQMADQALQYGRDQAMLYIQLADAVHYSNNVQAKSFEDKAIAAADAAARQYEAEKKAQAQSNALAKKNFENAKRLQIAQAIASTASAVVGTLGNQAPLLGPFAIPIATAMGALGAAQVAIIEKQQFTPRETGGTIYGNKAYVTSEGGPELFVPGRSGTMLSQKEIMEGLTNGRSSDVNVNFTIQAIDTQSAAQVIAANRGMIENIVRRATNKEMRK